jgi:Ca-activated chloride channel family protein
VNDTLMDVVTDAGNGAYVYLDSLDEADKMLGGRFDEVMGVAARDVQVKVTLPWYFKMLEFHGEEYSSDPAKVKPQDLAPGDAMVFHQILRACEATQIVDTDSIEVQASWKDPVTFAPLSAVTSQTMASLFSGADAELRRGRAIVAYAEALKGVSKVPAAQRRALLDKAILAVDQADPAKTDPDLIEIRSLLVTYENDVATP